MYYVYYICILLLLYIFVVIIKKNIFKCCIFFFSNIIPFTFYLNLILNTILHLFSTLVHLLKSRKILSSFQCKSKYHKLITNLKEAVERERDRAVWEIWFRKSSVPLQTDDWHVRPVYKQQPYVKGVTTCLSESGRIWAVDHQGQRAFMNLVSLALPVWWRMQG